tara:strand:+ start:168 stop:647 length:480 start_codon:yes stop_codon:yes gene_type:complete
MYSLVQDLEGLRIKRAKREFTLLSIPQHILHGRLSPLLDARALAQLSLADVACNRIRVRRACLLRHRLRQYTQELGLRTPHNFVWDACFRKDFRWRLHAAWGAGVHIDDVLFYNHFKSRSCRAIDSAQAGGPLWTFLRKHGSQPSRAHNTFGTYPPMLR